MKRHIRVTRNGDVHDWSLTVDYPDKRFNLFDVICNALEAKGYRACDGCQEYHSTLALFTHTITPDNKRTYCASCYEAQREIDRLKRMTIRKDEKQCKRS